MLANVTNQEVRDTHTKINEANAHEVEPLQTIKRSDCGVHQLLKLMDERHILNPGTVIP